METAATFIKLMETQKLTKNHCFKIVFSLIVLLSVTTHGDFDPTAFNLMMPPEGIDNLFGLPGALLGGLLLDLFGMSAVLLPIVFLIVKNHKNNQGKVIGAKLILLFLLFNSTFAILSTYYTDNISEYFGLWGVLTNQSIVFYQNTVIGLFLLIIMTAAYTFANIRNLKFDGLVFYILFLLVIGLKQAIGLSFKGFINSSLNILNLISGKLTTLFKHQIKSDLLYKLNLFNKIKQFNEKKKQSKLDKERYKRPSVLKKAKPVIKFHSPQKQLLHQAIEMYQKTNYPGNDTTIKTLDN